MKGIFQPYPMTGKSYLVILGQKRDPPLGREVIRPQVCYTASLAARGRCGTRLSIVCNCPELFITISSPDSILCYCAYYI